MGHHNAMIKTTLVVVLALIYTGGGRSQPQDPNYFFQQNQGRFVPFGSAAGAAGRSQQQQQQPGSYQEQTLFVNNGQNSGPIPAPSNVAESPPSFFQFPFSPPPRPDIFEISPRPFAVQPLPNNGFQYQRTANGFNIPPPPPIRQAVNPYLDTLGTIKRPENPPLTLQQHNKNRQHQSLQPDAALTNDGSSSSLNGNYLSQRGRGQQQNQQQVPAPISRESADIKPASGEFGKKSRIVTEYYNSQEQQQQQYRGVRGRQPSSLLNQFGQSQTAAAAGQVDEAAVNEDTDTERENNRLTQFGSREQSQRTDVRPPKPPQTFPSRNAKKVLQNKRPVNRNHIPLSPRINITHNGSTKFANELIKQPDSGDEDYYYDSNETKLTKNKGLYSDPAYYEDITPSSIKPPRKQVIIRRQKGQNNRLDGVESSTATTTRDFTTTGKYSLDELEDNDPPIITGSSEDYEELDYIVEKTISTTEAPRTTTTESTTILTTTTAAPRITRPTTTTPAPIESTTLTTKNPEDHTVILTSNFYLPKDQTEEDEEQTFDVSTEPVQHLDRTTEEVEEEYYEDDYEEEGDDLPVITTASTTLEPKSPVPTTTRTRSRDKVLGEQVVQVVTTKSVVNGTTLTNNPHMVTRPGDHRIRTTTEGYVVVASVQTSRSVSGARFLPFQVEQEEKKQTLADLEKLSEEEKDDPLLESSLDHAKRLDPEFDVTTPSSAVETSTTFNKAHSTSTNIPIPPAAQSTESIIDKLDRVQSELSSGVLSGKFPLLDETTESTTVRPSNQVVIKKFTPRTTTFKPIITTTPRKPEIKKFAVETTTPDELESLLPPGYKQKYSSYKKKQSSTTEPTVFETSSPSSTVEAVTRNASFVRSYKSGNKAQDLNIPGFSSSKNRVANNPESATTTTSTQSSVKVTDSFEALLPKDFKPKPSLLDRVQKVDISSFLPPGFKLDKVEEKTPEVVIQSDLSKFLPPGYKPPTESTKSPPAVIPLAKDEISKFLPPGFKSQDENVDSSTEKKPVTVIDDVSKFLPPGFKVPSYKSKDSLPSTLSPEYKPAVEKKTKEPVEEVKKESIFDKIQFKDVSALLPPGFKLPVSEGAESAATEGPIAASTTAASNSGKIVFPSRPGFAKKPGQRAPSSTIHKSAGPPPPVIGIRKGPPTRATTEFTGWPSVATTPLSIERLLEQQKAQAIDLAELLKGVTTSTTPATTTTRSTTTTTTARPTKPGLCRKECDLAGTIKLIDGIKWKPEYLDHNTQEWKSLAQDVEAELNEVYSHSKDLSKWFKKVRIDSFSKGSVLVDYFVELDNITGTVDTLEIKKLFHESLSPMRDDYQSDEPGPSTTSLEGDATFDRIVEQRPVKESFLLGRYVVDPISTDFIVIPKVISPTLSTGEENNIVPQWAVVVMVVGLVSLLFVIIFGVTVLVNRKKQAQKKAPTPLTADMLNELNKNHMGGVENYGADELYNVDDNWGDDYNDYKPKRFNNSQHGSGSNIYDSWRSQHHPEYYYDSHHYPHKKPSVAAYPPEMFVDPRQQHMPPQQPTVPMYTYNPRRYRDYEEDF